MHDATEPVAPSPVGDDEAAVLGRPAAENWSEAHEAFLGPIFDRVFAGETVAIDAHSVLLRRPDGGFEVPSHVSTWPYPLGSGHS